MPFRREHYLDIGSSGNEREPCINIDVDHVTPSPPLADEGSGVEGPPRARRAPHQILRPSGRQNESFDAGLERG